VGIAAQISFVCIKINEIHWEVAQSHPIHPAFRLRKHSCHVKNLRIPPLTKQRAAGF
jgi:hypothetical protein